MTDLTTIYVEELEYKDGVPTQWKMVPVELDTTDFSVDDTNLDGELCKIGQLVAYYGGLQAQMRMQVARRGDHVERLASEIKLKIRTQEKDLKVTEDYLKSRVATDDGYIQAKHLLYSAQRDSNLLENYFKAIIKKAEALNALTYYRKAEYMRGDV